jgi:protein phosphatase
MQPTQNAAPVIAILRGAAALRVAAVTDTGLVRRRNEDAFVFADLTPGASPTSASGRIDVGPGGVLLAVADGMGGHPDGDLASAIGVSTVARVMRDLSIPAHERLARAVNQAHADVCAAAGGGHGKLRMGTTLTAIHVDGRRAYVRHVGDSRAYLVRGDGIRRLTRDHSYTQMLIDMGVLRPSERWLSPYPSVLIQALGQERPLQIDASTIVLRDGDVLVLCSDGLTNRVADDEIARIIRARGALADACHELVDLAKVRGGDDNVTVLVAGVGSRPNPELTPSAGDASAFGRHHPL